MIDDLKDDFYTFNKVTLVSPYRLAKANAGDAGIDLRAISYKRIGGIKTTSNDTNITLPMGASIMVNTGVAFVECPPNLFGMVALRSSVGKKGVLLMNGVGIIDAGYRDPIKVMIQNNTHDSIQIKKNSRIAQLIILPNLSGNDNVISHKERGTGGFGSSNKGKFDG